MDDKNYWTMTRLSRRRVFRGAALGGVGLAGAALIGCGGDDADDAGAAPETTTAGGDGSADATTGAGEGGTDAKRGGTLAFHISAEPPNFDMHANSTYAVCQPVAPMYNQLLQYDPAFEFEPPDAVIPDLAESWEFSDDGGQVTFNLVQNAKFHNGQAFSSADIKASIERIMNPPEGVVSPRRDQFDPIASIDTPDDFTAVFNLSRPMSSLLPIVATTWNSIYSAEDIANDVDFNTTINGTGPFRLQEYLRGNRVSMVRNEEYHDDVFPYLDAINVFIVPDNSTALASFQSGELNVHRGPTPTDVEAIVQALGDEVVIDGPKPSYGFATVNFGQRDPWLDVRVRRAITMAISQAESIAVYGQGEGYGGGYLQPGGSWAISEEQLRTVPGYQEVNDQVLAEARKLLDAAGVPNPYDTTILTRKGASYERLSLFLKDEFVDIGVNAELDVQETAAAYDALNQRAFDMAPWSHAYALDDPDAVFAEFYLSEAPRNYSEVGSPEVDDLFLRQSSELDPEARLELIHEMEMKALDLYGKSIASWSTATEARYNFVKDRVKHSSTYNNQRWERVWLDL